MTTEEKRIKKRRCAFTRGIVCAAAQIAAQAGKDDAYVRMLISVAGGEGAVKQHGDAEDLTILFP